MGDSTLFSTKQPGGMQTLIARDQYHGSVFYVDSTHSAASDSVGFGRNPTAPFATIDYAIAFCTANSGDVILVMPGHAETITSVTADVAGIEIVGLSRAKPTLTLSATGSEINVTADDVAIRNIDMVGNINDLVNFIDNDANNLELDRITMTTSSTKEALCFINQATTKDDLTLKSCTAYQPTDPEGTGAAAGTGFIYCVDSERIKILDCTIVGFFETAIVHNKTTKCQELVVENPNWKQELSGAFPFVLVADSTGYCDGGAIRVPNADDVTEAKLMGTIGTKFWCGSTKFSNDSATGGQLMVAGSTATS